MNRRHLLLSMLILVSAVAHAQPLNLYVADDFHPLEDVVENATNAAAVIDGQRVILVKDCQVAQMAQLAKPIQEAQAAQIRFYVCEEDVRNTPVSALPAGLSVVRAEKSSEKEAAQAAHKSTLEKDLARLCLD